MKLDLELCREILLLVEREGDVDGLKRFPQINGREDDEVFYQIKKMNEAGFVTYKIFGKGPTSEYDYFKVDICYSGHEFLNQMLSDNVWAKTKELAKKGGLSLTFETIKAIIPVVINSLIR